MILPNDFNERIYVMKEKLREYINTIFADAPHSREIDELREEMLSDICEKYDDLVASGKSEAAAFNIAVAGIGDVSDLIEKMQNQKNENDTVYVGESDDKSHTASPEYETVNDEKYGRWRNLRAVFTAVAVAIYIISFIPVILLAPYNEILGVVCMFACWAVATCMIIFINMVKPTKLSRHSRPTCAQKHSDDSDDSDRHEKNPIYKAISACIWVAGICAYLVISFLSEMWHITWLVFPILVAIDNVLLACFDIAERGRRKEK